MAVSFSLVSWSGVGRNQNSENEFLDEWNSIQRAKLIS